MSAKDKQQPLLQAETTWFHVFRHMIESGDMAHMGGSAFMIYSTVKAYTNWDTGVSFPSLELLCEKTGLSKSQTLRCLHTLETMGYIVKEKVGRSNTYTLREKIVINDHEGRPAAAATWDYLPNGVREAQAELKNFLMTGDAADAKVVHIQNLTININTQVINDSAVGTQINSEKYPHIKDLVKKLETARKKTRQ